MDYDYEQLSKHLSYCVTKIIYCQGGNENGNDKGEREGGRGVGSNILYVEIFLVLSFLSV